MNRNRAPTRLWQTTTVRLALAFALVFGLGTAALLVTLDVAVGRFAEETARDALRDQVAVLVADANAEGGPALIASLQEQVSGGQPERFSYRVVAADGQRLDAGLPASVETMRGAGRFSIPAAADEGDAVSGRIEVFVLTAHARDGTFVAVGRDTYALAELRQWLRGLAWWGGSALVLLALAGGAGLGVLLLRRLQDIGAAAERVMGGDLSERLPSLGFGREFDDLAATLNAMLERLEAAMDAIRQVSSDVAHDLRTPLTRLRNTLEDAQSADAGAREGLIADAVEETDHLLEIFAALLRLAQIEGSGGRRFQKVNLSILATDVVDAYQPAADQSGRALSLEVDPVAMVNGDPTMLAQVIASLIDNALVHGAPGSIIHVCVRNEGEDVRLSVVDDGPGAPEEALKLLTRRFYRVDQSRHTAGSGLGLAMVAAIAALHEAPLAITNRTPGLAVSLTLPAVLPLGSNR